MQSTQNNLLTKGFSIIELIIVIVVIGILSAGISVAYIENQKYARTAKYQTDAKSIIKKAEIAAGDNDGQFPLVAGDFTGTAEIEPTDGFTIGSIIASSSSVPTSTTQIATPPEYSLHVCNNTRDGLRVYYPDPSISSTEVKYITTGKWSANC